MLRICAIIKFFENDLEISRANRCNFIRFFNDISFWTFYNSEGIIRVEASLEEKGKLTEDQKELFPKVLADGFCKLLLFKIKEEQIDGGLDQKTKERYDILVKTSVEKIENFLGVTSPKIDESTKTSNSLK